MVFLTVASVGVVAGLALGGRPARLADLQLRSLWLAYAAIGLQLAAFPSGVLPWSMPTVPARVLWLVSYALLVAMILRNRRLPGALLVGLGLACNVAAIVANHGLMPARASALRAAGLDYHLRNNSIALVHPHAAWLVDRWAVPAFIPLGNVYSVGDVVIAIGTLIVVVAGMVRGEDLRRRLRPPRRSLA